MNIRMELHIEKKNLYQNSYMGHIRKISSYDNVMSVYYPVTLTSQISR